METFQEEPHTQHSCLELNQTACLPYRAGPQGTRCRTSQDAYAEDSSECRRTSSRIVLGHFLWPHREWTKEED